MTDTENRQGRGPADLWKDQDMQTQTFTPDRLAQRAAGLDTHIRRRNLFEYAAAGAVIAFCLVISTLAIGAGIDTPADAIVVAGALTLAAGSAIVIWQMKARTGAPQASAGGEATVTAMRAELVRQRDALRQVWIWYLAPFAPGLMLIYGADFFRPDANMGLSLTLLTATLAVAVFICWLNLKAAARIEEAIVHLDAETGNGS